MSRCTSAIRKVPGSAARTKTPTGSCGNTCQRRRICPGSHNRISMRSLCASTPDQDKPWDFEPRQINCRPVLHRPLETTPFLGTCPRKLCQKTDETKDNLFIRKGLRVYKCGVIATRWLFL